MTVCCFCGINTQTAISYNMTCRKMPWLRTQTAIIPKIKTFTVWFYFNRKINYAYLFIAFILYYRLEKIDAFVMKSEVVIIY